MNRLKSKGSCRASTVYRPLENDDYTKKSDKKNWHRYEIINVNKKLDDSSEGKRTLGRTRSRWKNKLKWTLKTGCISKNFFPWQ
jgi:hypothetical protein